MGTLFTTNFAIWGICYYQFLGSVKNSTSMYKVVAIIRIVYLKK